MYKFLESFPNAMLAVIMPNEKWEKKIYHNITLTEAEEVNQLRKKWDIYFTPNGDNYNDTWYIKNLRKRNLQSSIISIFDRYGKLIKRYNADTEAWDGTFNGSNLPSNHYWFTLELTNGKTIKGHFTLKR